MKKIYLKISLIFITFITFISNISALSSQNNYYNLDFETEKQNIITDINDTSSKISLFDNNINYQDGYVVSNLTLDETSTSPIISTLTYYSNTGTKIMKETYNNYLFISIKSNKDSLYALVYEPTDTCNITNLSLKTLNEEYSDGIYKLIKLNEKLEIKKEITINNYEYNNISTQLIIKLIGYDLISIQNKEIAILGSDDIKTIDENFENINTLDQTIPNVTKYFPIFGIEFSNIIDMLESMTNLLLNDNEEQVINDIIDKTPLTIPISVSKNNKYIITSGLEFNATLTNNNDAYSLVIKEHNSELNKDIYYALSGTLKLTDLDNHPIWEQKTSDYALYLNTNIINNYIVTIGIKVDNPKDNVLIDDNIEEFLSNIDYHTDILIYDLKGNMLNKISNNSIYLNLYPSSNGFIVSNIDDNLTMNNKIYHLQRQINTNISGKGDINVISSSDPNKEVTIELNPKKGYKLLSLKVYTESGKEIELNSNKFIMPDEDITIEASFSVENPNTSDIAIPFTIILLIICSIIAIKSRKKLKWLKG